MDHIWYWFAYSFLGYCLEKLFAAATRSGHRLRRCFVFLPLCPVYGLALLAVLALSNIVAKFAKDDHTLTGE